MQTLIFLCLFTLFLACFASDCTDRCVPKSKAAFFSKAQALQSGACGYGALALGFNNGRLAAAAPSIYKDGAGCGACFQIRCKKQGICSKEGTVVVVSDLNRDNGTDFVLSSRAFMAMANKGNGQHVLKLGIADVEYKRVPCEYKKNLAIRVEKSSREPSYLAITFLYQGGRTEIVAADVATAAESPNWTYLSRNHGAVWETSRVPTGPLQFRFVVTAGFDGKSYWAKSVLPANWANGAIYDMGLQITDIAEDGCSQCDDGSWKP